MYPKEIINIINLNWLVVERAMIFFKSNWEKAQNEEPIKVIEEEKVIIRTLTSHPPLWRKGKIKEYNQTPATTIVLLWRSLLTGVGPSIAAVNQGWNINWADFPALHKTKDIEIIIVIR